MADYFDRLAQVESSGNPLAKAQTSSATGLYQMTRGTFDNLQKNATQPWVRNASWESHASNPEVQRNFAESLTSQNDAALRKAGHESNDLNKYLYHFAGAGGGNKLLRADQNASVAEILGPQAAAANPKIAKMTVGQMKDFFGKKLGAGAPAKAAAGPWEKYAKLAEGGKPWEKYKAAVPKREEGYDWKGLARAGLGQGLGFGFGDEIEAGARAAFGKGTYQENLKDTRAKIERFKEENPGTALTAELAGGFLLPGAGLVKGALTGAKAINAARATGNVGNVATSLAKPGIKQLAKTGALYGGAAGVGAAETDTTAPFDLQNEATSRLYGGATGAALGAGIGVAAPKVITGIGAGGKGLWNATLGRSSAGARQGEEAVARQLAKGEMSTQQMVDRLAADRDLGLPTRAFDANPQMALLAENIANQPGRGRELVVQPLAERIGNARSRVAERVQKDLGGGANFAATEQKIISDLKTQAAPLYDKAYAHGGVDNKVIDKLLDNKYFKAAYREAADISANEKLAREATGQTNFPSFAMQPLYKAEGGELVRDTTRVPDVRSLDYMKRGLDAIIEKGFKGGGMSSAEARSIKDLKNLMLKELDHDVPAYGQARKIYSDDANIRDALEFGRKQALRSGVAPADVEREMAEFVKGISDPAAQENVRKMIRIGASESVANEIGNKSRQVNAAAEIFGAPRDKEKFKILMGDGDDYNKFADYMTREADIFSHSGDIYRNSRTALRQELKTQLDPQSVLDQTFGNMASGQSGPGVVRSFLGNLKAPVERRNERIGELLSMGGDEASAKGLKETLDTAGSNLAKRENLTANIEQATAGGIPAYVKNAPRGYYEGEEELPVLEQPIAQAYGGIVASPLKMGENRYISAQNMARGGRSGIMSDPLASFTKGPLSMLGR